MLGETLSRPWTAEEAAEEAKNSDETLAEATMSRRRRGGPVAAGGADHSIGEETSAVDESVLLQRTVPADPPQGRPTEGG